LKWFRNKWILLISLALAGTVLAIVVNNTDRFSTKTEQFRHAFLHKEHLLKNFLSECKSNPYTASNDKKFNSLYYHYYRNDSLLYWNSNDLPVGRFSDLHYPANGVIHLQNGWYYALSEKVGKETHCVSFLIKHDYPYENSELKNVFQSDFELDKQTTISLDQDEGIKISDDQGNYAFSVISPATADESSTFSQWMLFSYCLLFTIWMALLLALFRGWQSSWRWLIPTALIGFKFYSLSIGLFHFNVGSGALDPSIYATNKWFPNLFEYLTNVLVICTLSLMLEQSIKKATLSKRLAFIPLAFSILFWLLVRDLTEGLVENSSIPLSIDKLFSLNGYTILAVFSIGSLLYIQYRLIVASLQCWFKAYTAGKSIFVVSGVMITFLISWIYWIEHQTILPELMFCLFLFPVLYSGTLRRKENPLGLSVLILSAGTLCITLLFMLFNGQRERTIQELYAQKLATEQNIVTELEYPKISSKITTDPVLTRIRKEDQQNLSSSEFEDGLERRIFNGFWERYELDFFLFDSTGVPLMTEGEDMEEDQHQKLVDIIEKHGQVSTIDSHVYFITDHTEQYAYVIKQELRSNSNESRTLIATLRSKKIPEEIGFPRLLLSGNADALQYLENYSIAKYHKNRLVISYGAFTYPFRQTAIDTWKASGNYRTYDGYAHYILKTDSEDVIILSSERSTLLSFISSFSYLFLFFGCFFIHRFFRFKKVPELKRTLSLSVRIQVILIGIVFVSLIAFGWGSGAFVRRQYDVFSTDMIVDKLRSMTLEINNKTRYRDGLSVEKNGNVMEATLEKMSRIYRTDANLYDVHGFMIASSRSKIYKLGLVGDQMNRKALFALQSQNKSRFIQQEHIGALDYASAYMPCFNKRGKLLGFLNLQYFGQQRELEEQIENFLVAIINIFMLLLALSVLSALFISSWLTAPLRLLKDNVSRLKLGGLNEPIFYGKDDEIGALVTAYNAKLEELEYTASQLARSERESAWREMAKQVAHEIKNPLTPMKLSVQQLERSYDPADPQNAARISKVASSLVEQIDALTRIANEFSQFAQMPLPNETEVELIDLIENVKALFEETSERRITFHHRDEKVYIQADKDQIIRVFNNLIKNAVQAADPSREFKIVISLDMYGDKIEVTVADTGSGIPKEEQQMIFIPHFTTKSSGSGLGLAMVKQIIENHKGKISFESATDKGTTFKIILPKK
jgi:signal transduction histidine kinase